VEAVSSTQAREQSNGAGEVRPAAVCPHFHAAIEMIGKRWTGAIVCALIEGPMRYGEFSKTIPGLSDRLLSQRLRELEAEGLVERAVEAGTPVRVTYSLTERGTGLAPAIRELRVWANEWYCRR
jgi:DNA-binding HxlR family transcriptional regulator